MAYTTISLHFGGVFEHEPKVEAHINSSEAGDIAVLSIDSNVSLFFHDKASLFRFANSVTRAAANIMKPGECATCGFDVELLGHAAECPEADKPQPADCLCSEWGGKPNPKCPIHSSLTEAEPPAPSDILDYTNKEWDMVSKSVVDVLRKSEPDGPVADSDDGYKITQDQQENDEPMTIGHKSGCLCSDCVCERTRVIELGNKIEEAR